MKCSRLCFGGGVEQNHGEELLENVRVVFEMVKSKSLQVFVAKKRQGFFRRPIQIDLVVGAVVEANVLDAMVQAQVDCVQLERKKVEALIYHRYPVDYNRRCEHTMIVHCWFLNIQIL